jgi:hypothetical protein
VHAENDLRFSLGGLVHAENDLRFSLGPSVHPENDLRFSLGGLAHAKNVLRFALGPSVHAENDLRFAIGRLVHVQNDLQFAMKRSGAPNQRERVPATLAVSIAEHSNQLARASMGAESRKRSLSASSTPKHQLPLRTITWPLAPAM